MRQKQSDVSVLHSQLFLMENSHFKLRYCRFGDGVGVANSSEQYLFI